LRCCFSVEESQPRWCGPAPTCMISHLPSAALHSACMSKRARLSTLWCSSVDCVVLSSLVHTCDLFLPRLRPHRRRTWIRAARPRQPRRAKGEPAMPIWDELGLSKWTIASVKIRRARLPSSKDPGSCWTPWSGSTTTSEQPQVSPHPVFFLLRFFESRATARQGAPEGRIGSAARAKLIQGLTVLTRVRGAVPQGDFVSVPKMLRG